MRNSPGKQALVFRPSEASWATTDFVRKPPAIALVVTPYILLMMATVGVVYAHFATVPEAVEAQGTLAAGVPPVAIRAVAVARVTRLNVQEGSRVKSGDVLAETDAQVAGADLARLRAETTKLRRLLDSDRAGRCDGRCVAAVEALAKVSFAAPGSPGIREMLLQIQDLLHEYLREKRRQRRGDPMVAELARQRAQAEKKLAVIRQSGALGSLAPQVDQLQKEIGEVTSRIHDRRIQVTTGVEQARNRLLVRVRNLVPALENFQSMQTIYAPISGVVTGLTVSGANQQLTAGQKLLDLIPSDTNLVAELGVTNQDISKVRPGMRVILKMDALPEREFGQIAGEIVEIPVATEMREGGRATPIYRVRTSLAAQTVTKAGVEYPFKIGMTFNALVVVREETLLKLGISKVLNLKDSLFGAW